MHIRSTKDGRVVVRFESTDNVPDEGFVESIGGDHPPDLVGIPLIVWRTSLIIGDKILHGTNISVERAKVIVYRFDSGPARETGDLNKATLIGGASSHQDLVALSESGGFLAYQEFATWKPLTYAQVEKVFGREPWVSM